MEEEVENIEYTAYTLWHDMCPMPKIMRTITSDTYPILNLDRTYSYDIDKDQFPEIKEYNESLGFRWLESINRFVSPDDLIEERESVVLIDHVMYFKRRSMN